MLLVALPASAQESTDDGAVAVLQQGQEAYTNNCSGCHQPSGAGLPGQIPPLIGNPATDDAAYVREVIANGRSGELVVNGVTYDGAMPAFPSLSDADMDAIIAFIQADFVVPGGGDVVVDAGGTAGTELPGFVSGMVTLGILVAAGVAAWVMAPRVIGVIDRGNTPALDAWAKSILIVVYFAVGAVFIPSRVLETETLQRVPEPVADIVALGLWFGAFAVGGLALWWFQRQDRI